MGFAYCPRATWFPPPAKAYEDENKMIGTNNVIIRIFSNFILLFIDPPTHQFSWFPTPKK
jgi:hypothetical protein